MSDWFAERRFLVTGGHGFLGQRVCAALRARGARLIAHPSHSLYDLRSAHDIHAMLTAFRPNVVIHLAARVGGIEANRRSPAQFFYDNLVMGAQLLHESWLQISVDKFVTVGTVCSYPKFSHVPFSEDELWDGYPEETNAPYGIAKKALLVQAQAYRQQYGFNAIYLIPANLFGPGDHVNPVTSHVIPALIYKFSEAVRLGQDVVTLWGTGRPTREFLFVEDAAEGLLRAAEHYDSPEPMNLGTGREVSIRHLAQMVAGAVGYKGRVEWDASRPDGQPRRALDVSRARTAIQFEAQVSLEDGLERTVAWYRARREAKR